MSAALVEDDAVVLPFNDLNARSYTITSTEAAPICSQPADGR